MLRLSGTLLLLAALAALLAVSAGAAAEPQRGFFDITVRGEVVKQWRFVQNNPETECEIRRTFTGRETFTFRSSRPTRVLIRSRADGSLILGALLRNISGSYRQTGTRNERSTAAECRNPVSFSSRCTPPPRRGSHTGGTISLSSPRKGVIRLGKLRLPVRINPALTACEPREVAQLPTRAEVATARATAADVFDPKARAVELDASAVETTTFSGGDNGRAVVTVKWTVAFEPVP